MGKTFKQDDAWEIKKPKTKMKRKKKPIPATKTKATNKKDWYESIDDEFDEDDNFERFHSNRPRR
tara:strand:+ start:337 stop:531 length:195 start_codon:yes stop_codon:yes gene_type:complete